MQTSSSVKVINEKLEVFGRVGYVVETVKDAKGKEKVNVMLDGDTEATAFDESDLFALN